MRFQPIWETMQTDLKCEQLCNGEEPPALWHWARELIVAGIVARGQPHWSLVAMPPRSLKRFVRATRQVGTHAQRGHISHCGVCRVCGDNFTRFSGIVFFVRHNFISSR